MVSQAMSLQVSQNMDFCTWLLFQPPACSAGSSPNWLLVRPCTSDLPPPLRVLVTFLLLCSFLLGPQADFVKPFCALRSRTQGPVCLGRSWRRPTGRRQILLQELGQAADLRQLVVRRGTAGEVARPDGGGLESGPEP